MRSPRTRKIGHFPMVKVKVVTMRDATVRIDQAGRLVIPKRIRKTLRLKTGDTLAVRLKGNVIELQPTRAGIRLEHINGVLVLAGSLPLPACDLVSEAREEHIHERCSLSVEV